jgi:hypothetical protein
MVAGLEGDDRGEASGVGVPVDDRELRESIHFCVRRTYASMPAFGDNDAFAVEEYAPHLGILASHRTARSQV